MERKIKDLPIFDRPREKLLTKGAQALADWELLAIILGKGTKKSDVVTIAKKLITVIDEYGIKMQAQDILKIDGIGQAKATTIAAAFEFVRRRIRSEGLKIISPLDVIPLLQHYSDRKQEHFICISVNGANEVIQVRVITIGLVNQSQVHPREVFADAIAERATSVIVAHNHPSGNVRPSKEDINITKRLKEAAKILGINLLDHIIFTRKKHYSFLEHDIL